jgi:hypothetical protein
MDRQKHMPLTSGPMYTGVRMDNIVSNYISFQSNPEHPGKSLRKFLLCHIKLILLSA